MRRIRETHLDRLPPALPKVRPEDVSILFVLPTERGSEIRQLRMDQQGRLIECMAWWILRRIVQ